MSDATIIFFLSLCIVLLICVILYQQFVFRTGIQAKLQKISGKLKEISDTDSDERIMVFTENKELMELAAQINRLLENHLKTKADYRRTEIASKKMLSNISHDIKTPMTVILGYLEIMRINGTGTDEMIKKTEQKAQNVMELINQFFTLAKLESGDMDIELSRINVCEVCRESILDFYEILTNNEFQVDIDMPENPIYVQIILDLALLLAPKTFQPALMGRLIAKKLHLADKAPLGPEIIIWKSVVITVQLLLNSITFIRH